MWIVVFDNNKGPLFHRDMYGTKGPLCIVVPLSTYSCIHIYKGDENSLYAILTLILNFSTVNKQIVFTLIV